MDFVDFAIEEFQPKLKKLIEQFSEVEDEQVKATKIFRFYDSGNLFKIHILAIWNSIRLSFKIYDFL